MPPSHLIPLFAGIVPSVDGAGGSIWGSDLQPLLDAAIENVFRAHTNLLMMWPVFPRGDLPSDMLFFDSLAFSLKTT